MFYRQNVVDLKPYDSMLIANEVVQKPAMAVNDPMVPQELHRQRRSFDPEEEKQMMDEHDNGSISEDSTETVSELPDPSNEDSEQSNEVQNSQESNEVQKSRESNEIQDSQESNEIQNSQQSGEEYNVPQGLPDPHSYESEEGSYESEGNTNDSSVSTDNSSVSDDSMYSDDDNEEFIITTTTSPLLQT